MAAASMANLTGSIGSIAAALVGPSVANAPRQDFSTDIVTLLGIVSEWEMEDVAKWAMTSARLPEFAAQHFAWLCPSGMSLSFLAQSAMKAPVWSTAIFDKDIQDKLSKPHLQAVLMALSHFSSTNARV
jgi:hypothetical protein